MFWDVVLPGNDAGGGSGVFNVAGLAFDVAICCAGLGFIFFRNLLLWEESTLGAAMEVPSDANGVISNSVLPVQSFVPSHGFGNVL